MKVRVVYKSFVVPDYYDTEILDVEFKNIPNLLNNEYGGKVRIGTIIVDKSDVLRVYEIKENLKEEIVSGKNKIKSEKEKASFETKGN